MTMEASTALAYSNATAKTKLYPSNKEDDLFSLLLFGNVLV